MVLFFAFSGRRSPVASHIGFNRIVRRPLMTAPLICAQNVSMRKRESELVDAQQLAEIGVGKKQGLRVNLVANLQETISAGGRDFQAPDDEPGEQSLALEESADDSCCPSIIGRRIVSRDFVHQRMPFRNAGDWARGGTVEGTEALLRRIALQWSMWLIGGGIYRPRVATRRGRPVEDGRGEVEKISGGGWLVSKGFRYQRLRRLGHAKSRHSFANH